MENHDHGSTDTIKQPIKKVCSRCGSEEVGREAAIRWNTSLQRYEITTVYDGGFCDHCEDEAELKDVPFDLASEVLLTFTVFVAQADGRGTTHISAHEAVDSAEAQKLALAETIEDWGSLFSEKSLRVVGVAAGDVKIVSWDIYD